MIWVLLLSIATINANYFDESVRQALQVKHNPNVYTRNPEHSMRAAFDGYNAFFNKTHKSPYEKQIRFSHFLRNSMVIDKLNSKRNKSDPSDAWFGFTVLSDLSVSEFKQLNGLKLKTPLQKSNKVSIGAPAGSVNWVAAGKTTAVKNQGQCGSCWTFSAVETAESANLMKGNGAGGQPGSEQEIVDCDSAGGGCGGGDPRQAIQWIQQIGGIELNSCYPYEGQQGSCQSSSCSAAYSVNNVMAVPADENAIYNYLRTYGPLSIGVDAQSWQNYGGGIVKGGTCGQEQDHAVQLVGYGPAYGGYWIVRNSWGPGWGGIGGYILLQWGTSIDSIIYIFSPSKVVGSCN